MHKSIDLSRHSRESIVKEVKSFISGYSDQQVQFIADFLAVESENRKREQEFMTMHQGENMTASN